MAHACKSLPRVYRGTTLGPPWHLILTRQRMRDARMWLFSCSTCEVPGPTCRSGKWEVEPHVRKQLEIVVDEHKAAKHEEQLVSSMTERAARLKKALAESQAHAVGNSRLVAPRASQPCARPQQSPAVFEHEVPPPTFRFDKWDQAPHRYLNEQAALKPETSRGVYVFSDLNPYVGHPNPLKEGQELFHKGLLSEAVLALEAEVLKNPDNAECWRLLGVTHAENDDDQQAIAAMMRAQEVDPTNLEILLALGVSHTNELEQAAALKYLYSWLRHHPKYGTIAPSDQPENLYYADVARLFSDAAKLSPDDADVHIVLGVLYNLSGEYDKAIEAFQTALKLKPQDYSLWNKLGATQANSVQTSDAILAYQQALDLKPNYVRAWANMGISYANQGMYEDSIRYYVRALMMNPKADNAWQYLRMSLSCASRSDMMEACESRNLDILQKEFPL
ncbi:hypothetical protein BUALT_Bualt18G0081200 [Buddleja alternifolia]|uniref:Peroxin-5 n=1 Tax=Buddleja alternifolia TaxID=168488 RepID=A0AAV6WE26_9LAMI|nr:hypothetical protein BUALT_Bualt18G0081200 [Buddleja alternifolia]